MQIRWLNDNDIFISYAHLDGGTYAEGLADKLSERGFSYYIDRRGSEPGKELPETLRQRIRRSAMLVIIGTEQAASRAAIEAEIEEFLSSRRRKPIVPIDFENAVSKARWYHLVEGIDPEVEASKSALEDGKPSRRVIDRIEKYFSYTRLRKRLRLATQFASGVLLVLLMAIGIATIYARSKFKEATEYARQVNQAQLQLRTMNAEVAEAQEELKLAGHNLEMARVEQAKQADLARKTGLELKEKTRLVNVAERQADDANKAAQSARIEADREQAISDSLRLANQSQRQLAQASHFILPSVELAVDALKRFPTTEADSALRKGLSMLPRRRRVEQYAGDILDADLSPDGQHLAILTSNNIIQIYQSGEQTPLKEFPCRDRIAGPRDYSRRLITISNDALYAAVISGNDAFVVNLKTDRSHSIKLVYDGFSVRQIALSPDGRYIVVAYAERKPRYPRFSRAKLLAAANGEPVSDLVDDLSTVRAVGFGSKGDLILSGSRLIDLQLTGSSTNPARVVDDARRVVVWPLSDKFEKQPGVKLTKEDFDRKVETRVPTLEGELSHVPNDSIAMGPTPWLIGTRSTIYELTGDNYEPMSYIPYTTSKDGSPTSERRYAFNRAGTEAIVLTAKSFPTVGEWQGAGSLPQIERLAESSRSLWSLEWWDLGGYPSQAFATRSMVQLNFERDGCGILVRPSVRNLLPVQCLKATGKETEFAESKPLRALSSILDISSNLEFTVTTDTETVSVVKSCESKEISIPLPNDLKYVRTATITNDGRFLALISSSEKSGTTADLYELRANQYERLRRVQLPSQPLSVELSSNGKYAIINTRQGSRLLDLINDREILIPGLEGGGIKSMSFSPDAEFLVIFDVDSPTSASTRVLPLRNLNNGQIWNYQWSEVFFRHFMFFSDSGRLLLDLCPGGPTKLIDLKTRRVQEFNPALYGLVAAFSADERYVALAAQGEGVIVYRTDDVQGGPAARLRIKGLVSALAISPDNRFVATGNNAKSYSTSSYEDVLRLWPLQADDLIKEGTERLSIKLKSSQ